MKYPARGIAFRRAAAYKARLGMSANPTESAAVDMAQRDRLLRRLVGCFAAAAFVAFGLAITTSVWQRTLGHFDPVTLAQDAAR